MRNNLFIYGNPAQNCALRLLGFSDEGWREPRALSCTAPSEHVPHIEKIQNDHSQGRQFTCQPLLTLSPAHPHSDVRSGPHSSALSYTPTSPWQPCAVNPQYVSLTPVVVPPSSVVVGIALTMWQVQLGACHGLEGYRFRGYRELLGF